MLPVSIVDHDEFRSFVATLDARYKPSSRTHFSRKLIPQQYEIVKQRVVQSLSKIDYCAFTSDLWTGCHNKAYISLTVHFVNSSMEMKNYCLATKEIPEAHTAVNLAEVLKSAFTEWSLSEKVYGFCTDNAQNIVNAVINNLQVLHLPCFGHTLQLSVQKAFNLTEIAVVLGKVRKLVGHFKKSSKATYCLREKQRLLNLPEHELIQHCDTRWGSVYAMLERFLEQQAAVCAVLMGNSERNNRVFLPEGRDCNLIEEMVVVLKPFVQATTLMSGSSYPTVGIVSPLLFKLLNRTLAVTENDSRAMQNVKRAIYNDLSHRYNDPQLKHLLNMCAFLDPRFKDLNPFISEEERCDISEAVKLEMHSFLNAVFREEDTPSPAGSPSPSKKRKLAESLFDDFNSSRRKKTSSAEVVDSELRRYAEEDLLDYESDPLKWWHDRKSQYPTLCNVVRKLWCIPSTSVRSEELFSLAGNILSPKRNRLLPENVDYLVFLCNNI